MDPMYVVDKEADKGKGEEALLSAANLQLSEDDNVLAQGVEGDKYAIGYFGYAYFEENEGKLAALAVEGVAPSAEAVNEGDVHAGPPVVHLLGCGCDGGQAAGRRRSSTST